MMGGTFENREAEILPPKKTIVSEIDVAENFIIADLNLRLTLSHTNVSSLDGYLTGPDGMRIELFTAVGGRDDHFEKTIFDDQASVPIVKARPPFEGSFQPEGLVKRQPGLGAFNGKSIEGAWQLTIRCSRSDRFGLLHSWALMARPDEESLLNRPDLEASIASELATEGSTSASTDPSQISSQPRQDTPGDLGSTDDSRQQSSEAGIRTNSAASFWTAERKAEYADKFRKPSSAEWEKMSDEQKRQRMADRSKAIEEYKRALADRRDESAMDRGGKIKMKDFKVKQ
jgi:subtilisin-like proprotein convertase family protein